MRGMSSDITTNTDAMPLNARIEGYLRTLVTVAGGHAQALPFDITGDWPEALASDAQPVTVTPADARDALTRFHANAVAHGSPKAAADLPSEPAYALAQQHKVTAGVQKNQRVSLWAQCLKSLRRSERSSAKAARTAHTIATKGFWTCEGVFVQKDGKDTADLRQYPSQRKARNAGANKAYGSDWYKTDKDLRKAEQVVAFTPAEGTVETTTVATPVQEVVTPAPAAPVTTDRVSSLMGLSKAALVAQAGGMGMATSGTKTVLATRIDEGLTALGL